MSTALALIPVTLCLSGFAYVAIGVFQNRQIGINSTRETFSFRRSGKATRLTKSRPAARNPYRATSIVNEGNSCAAVKKLLNTRFLDVDKDIPSLPVAGCNIGHCNCKYVKHEDRREDSEDRRTPLTLRSDLYEQAGNENRRSTRGGRRKRDFDHRSPVRYTEFASDD